MAATRLIALHQNKGKTIAQCLADRTDYSENEAKTDGGKYISTFQCDPKSCDQEFLLTKKEYEQRTGRHQENNVIAYQIRQSFKPGEITPEEANRVGYELAMRWTKGNHAFLVATHVDKAHIHNHIIYNSTNLEGTHKYRNFFLSGKALQRTSDILCLEHGLSVIVPGAAKKKYHEERFRPSKRDELRKTIDRLMEKKPETFETLIKGLEEAGYVLKLGSTLAIRKQEEQRFVRFSSLGNGYTEFDLKNRIEGKNYKRDFDYVKDISEIISKKRGAAYEVWARRFNLKQTAKALCFLQEQGIESLEKLDSLVNESAKVHAQLLDDLKAKEKRMREIGELRKHIFDYAATRSVYLEYKTSDYDSAFFEKHRDELTRYRMAKHAFNELTGKRLPKVSELNEEYRKLQQERKQVYEQYRTAKEEMRTYQIARENIRRILEDEGEEKKADKARERVSRV